MSNLPVTTTRRWQRFAVAEALQIPALVVLMTGQGVGSLLFAAIWGSLICAGGTDSAQGDGARLARWLNRILVAQATLWIVAALVLGFPS